VGRISTMAFSWSWFTDNSFVPDYTICMIDSWLFYLLVLGFGFLAIYLMDIGIFK